MPRMTEKPRKMHLIKLNPKVDSYCHIIGKFKDHLKNTSRKLEALNDINYTYKYYIESKVDFGTKLRRAYLHFTLHCV